MKACKLRVSVSSAPSLCWQTLHRNLNPINFCRAPAVPCRGAVRRRVCALPSRPPHFAASPSRRPAFHGLQPSFRPSHRPRRPTKTHDDRVPPPCAPRYVPKIKKVERRHSRCGGLWEGTIERIMGIAIANRYFRSFFLIKKGKQGQRETALNSKAESHQGPPCKVSKSLRTRSGEHFSLFHPQALLLASQQPALSQAAPGVTCNSSISTASPVLMIGLIDTRNRTFARQKCIVLSEKAAWSLRAAPDANFCNVCPPPPCPNSKFPIRLTGGRVGPSRPPHPHHRVIQRRGTRLPSPATLKTAFP